VNENIELFKLPPSSLAMLFASLIGAAIPSLVLGRVVFAVVVGLGVVALLASELRAVAWQHLIKQIRSPIGILVLATLAVWMISSLGSNFPVRSVEASVRSGLFVAIGAMIYAGLQANTLLLRWCLCSFIAASFIAIVVAMIEITALPELYWALRLKGWLSISLGTKLKAFSSLAVIVIPVLALSARRCRSYWSVSAVIAIVGIVALVWLTYNRAAIAGFLCIFLTIFLCQAFRFGAHKHVVMLLSGFAASCASILIWLRISRGHYLDAIHQPHASGATGSDWLIPVWLVDFQRQTMWDHALRIAEKAPWLGIGPNTINFVPSADQPLPGNESLHIIPAHPHNWIVEIIAETGAFGFFALLTLILFAIGSLLLQYRRTGSFAALSSIAIMAGYWGSGLFNFSYWSAWWQVSFVLALAISGVMASTTVRHEVG